VRPPLDLDRAERRECSPHTMPCQATWSTQTCSAASAAGVRCGPLHAGVRRLGSGPPRTRPNAAQPGVLGNRSRGAARPSHALSQPGAPYTPARGRGAHRSQRNGGAREKEVANTRPLRQRLPPRGPRPHDVTCQTQTPGAPGAAATARARWFVTLSASPHICGMPPELLGQPRLVGRL
jgi:hypothetical protein